MISRSSSLGIFSLGEKWIIRMRSNSSSSTNKASTSTLTPWRTSGNWRMSSSTRSIFRIQLTLSNRTLTPCFRMWLSFQEPSTGFGSRTSPCRIPSFKASIISMKIQMRRTLILTQLSANWIVSWAERRKQLWRIRSCRPRPSNQAKSIPITKSQTPGCPVPSPPPTQCPNP